MTIKDLVRQHVLLTIEKRKGDKALAADDLGICLKTLYNMLSRWGLHTPMYARPKKRDAVSGKQTFENFKSENGSHGTEEQSDDSPKNAGDGQASSGSPGGQQSAYEWQDSDSAIDREKWG